MKKFGQKRGICLGLSAGVFLLSAAAYAAKQNYVTIEDLHATAVELEGQTITTAGVFVGLTMEDSFPNVEELGLGRPWGVLVDRSLSEILVFGPGPGFPEKGTMYQVRGKLVVSNDGRPVLRAFARPRTAPDRSVSAVLARPKDHDGRLVTLNTQYVGHGRLARNPALISTSVDPDAALVRDASGAEAYVVGLPSELTGTKGAYSLDPGESLVVVARVRTDMNGKVYFEFVSERAEMIRYGE